MDSLKDILEQIAKQAGGTYREVEGIGSEPETAHLPFNQTKRYFHIIIEIPDLVHLRHSLEFDLVKEKDLPDRLEKKRREMLVHMAAEYLRLQGERNANFMRERKVWYPKEDPGTSPTY